MKALPLSRVGIEIASENISWMKHHQVGCSLIPVLPDTSIRGPAARVCSASVSQSKDVCTVSSDRDPGLFTHIVARV
jgi:hypothetical protein